MAVVRPGPIVADIRGSIGDTTFARNKGGLYAKARTTPANPQSDAQTYTRNAITAISKAWSAALTATQRANWRAYARSFPQLNTWGNPTHTTGYTRYVAHNMLRTRWQASLLFPALPTANEVYFKTPPSTGPLHPPTMNMSATSAADIVRAWIPPQNYNPPPYGLSLWIYQTNQVNPGCQYPTWEQAFVGYNVKTGTWLLNPWTWVSPFPLDPAMRLWCWTTAQDWYTGAMSTPHLQTEIVDNPHGLRLPIGKTTADVLAQTTHNRLRQQAFSHQESRGP